MAMMSSSALSKSRMAGKPFNFAMQSTFSCKCVEFAEGPTLPRLRQLIGL
jgi:hypothetical protein